MNSTCEKKEGISAGQADVFATVPVVDKALTTMRLFLKEQMMLDFRDAEQYH